MKSHGLKNLRFAPLWLTPWLLTTMLLSYISARLVAVFSESDPSFVVNNTNVFSGVMSSALAFGFKRFCEYAASPYSLFCLPSIMVGVASFQKKLDGHRNMLESMKSFNVRNAQCALVNDRSVIEAPGANVCVHACLHVCMYACHIV